MENNNNKKATRVVRAAEKALYCTHNNQLRQEGDHDKERRRREAEAVPDKVIFSGDLFLSFGSNLTCSVSVQHLLFYPELPFV